MDDIIRTILSILTLKRLNKYRLYFNIAYLSQIINIRYTELLSEILQGDNHNILKSKLN